MVYTSSSSTEMWGYQRAQLSDPFVSWLIGDARGMALLGSLLGSLTAALLEEF